MANPSAQVPSLQQLGLTAHLQSPEEALKSLQSSNTLPPGWNTAAQQSALPRPAPFPSHDAAFASPLLAPQQPSMLPRTDPNAALAGLLHGTIAPALIPNPSQFLLRNFGIDITGARPRWVGLNHLRGNLAPQPPPPAAAPRSGYAPQPLTQFLHSDYEPQQMRMDTVHHQSSVLHAPQSRPTKPAAEKRKEHSVSHEQPPKRQTHAQAQAALHNTSLSDEPASDWVPPSTGRDPFHERVGSIPLVDLRAQSMSYLQDFMAQVIRDAGKVPLPTLLAGHAHSHSHSHAHAQATTSTGKKEPAQSGGANGKPPAAAPSARADVVPVPVVPAAPAPEPAPAPVAPTPPAAEASTAPAAVQASPSPAPIQQQPNSEEAQEATSKTQS